MVLIAVRCPYCQSDHSAKRGKTETGKQRYRCHNLDCPHQSFLLNPAYKGRLPEIKAQIIDMALNGSGIRDTARVLGVSTDTVINWSRGGTGQQQFMMGDPSEIRGCTIEPAYHRLSQRQHLQSSSGTILTPF